VEKEILTTPWRGQENQQLQCLSVFRRQGMKTSSLAAVPVISTLGEIHTEDILFQF
jgi:hypothetical protein